MLAEAPPCFAVTPLLPPAVLWQMHGFCDCISSCNHSMVEHAISNNLSVFPARGHMHLVPEKRPLTSLAVKAVFYTDRRVISFSLPTFFFPL